VHGRRNRKLDVINDILVRLGSCPTIACVASEENEEPTILKRGVDGGKYCVVFDPLDGSSNLDVCGGVGTIFSILRHDRRSGKPEDSCLQPGKAQVAAGYILYGSSTIFVLTTGNGVSMFVLDPSIGAFLRVADRLQIPKAGKTCEQLIGRTHRQGQTADCVWFDYYDHVGPAREAIEEARSRAVYIQSTMNTPQRLCYGAWEE
jgi:fructose-1,6-bisphosphatase I